MAESAKDLQTALNSLREYCNEWSLKIDIDKTKIVIFSRGKVRKYPKFYLNESEIEVVSEYTYLGVIFSCNGSFKNTINKQIAQAKKAIG